MSRPKHYVACGFGVRVVNGAPVPDDQHESFRIFDCLPWDLHEYPAAHLRDTTAAGFLAFLD